MARCGSGCRRPRGSTPPPIGHGSDRRDLPGLCDIPRRTAFCLPRLRSSCPPQDDKRPGNASRLGLPLRGRVLHRRRRPGAHPRCQDASTATIADDGTDFVLVLADMAPAPNRVIRIAGCHAAGSPNWRWEAPGRAGTARGWCDPVLAWGCPPSRLPKPGDEAAGQRPSATSRRWPPTSRSTRLGDRMSAEDREKLSPAAMGLVTPWLLARARKRFAPDAR